MATKSFYKILSIKEHCFPPMQISQQAVNGHRLVVNIGQPINVHWKNSNNMWNCKQYKTGDFSLVPDGEHNETYWDQDINIIIIEMNQDFTEQTLDFSNLELKEVRGVSDNIIYQLAIYLKEELKYGKLAGRIYGQSIAIGLAIQLGTKYNALGKEIYAPKGKLSSAQLKRIVDYCYSNIDYEIGIQELSQQVNLSPFHFIRLFKNTIGFTPYQFVIQTRIEKSKQLIKQDKYSLTEIAHNLGFTDQAHFSNLFRKVIGISPREFAKI